MIQTECRFGNRIVMYVVRVGSPWDSGEAGKEVGETYLGIKRVVMVSVE